MKTNHHAGQYCLNGKKMLLLCCGCCVVTDLRSEYDDKVALKEIQQAKNNKDLIEDYSEPE